MEPAVLYSNVYFMSKNRASIELSSSSIVASTPNIIVSDEIPEAALDMHMTADAVRTSSMLQQGKQVDRIYPYFSYEKPGAKGEVTINGYKYFFNKGESIRIPEAVALIYDAKFLSEFSPIVNEFKELNRI